MRLASALLAVALPAAVAAQPAHPPDRPAAAEHKPTHRATGAPAAAPARPHPAKPQAALAKPPPKLPAKPTPPKPPPAAPAPVAPPPPPADPRRGSNTGLPVPRFAALKTDDVNFRKGPGTRYPIDWVYKRRDLPVEIERENDVWRLVSDPDGTKGWVHAATLTGRRTAIVTGGDQLLRAGAADTAPAVAKVASGVILRVRSCEATSEWCQVQVSDYRGWIKRNQVWGIQPGEAIQ